MTRYYCRPSDFDRQHDPPIDAAFRGNVDEAQREAMFQLYVAGWELSDLARVYGTTWADVFTTISRRKRELRRRLAAGEGVYKIAREFGLLVEEVRRLTER
jgi:hypothetical protein